ncbi:MAG TPA: PAS domain S-box protein, partial [Desulfosalsimonadaceae bacterium]|nr:PAS domain S-box protein [Desulfosalsimonadaceae bacterium]
MPEKPSYEELEQRVIRLEADNARYHQLVENLTNTVLENLPGGVFTHDLDGRIKLVNRAAAKNTGYLREELLDMSVQQIDPGSIARDDLNKVWRSMRRGEAVTILSTHTRKDGSEYPAEIHLNAVELDGKPHILTIAFDITDRKNAEMALREREERYRFLVEESNDIIWTFDLTSMRYTYCSKSVQRILGFSQDEAIGAKLDHIFTKETKNRIVSAFEKAATDQNSPDRILIEAEHCHKQAGLVWMEINALLHRDSFGRPVSFTGVSRDITERKLNEEALRESEDRFNKVLQAVPDMVSIQDPEMNILYSNWNGFGAVAEKDRVLHSKCYRTYRGYDDICPDCRALSVIETG